MPRKRDLKHSFFTNEDLADLPALTRLMFQAMWCVADRNGRLEDRPRRIKIECLPFDDHDIEGALDALTAAGFIDRYEAEGQKLIEVVNFSKHQRPHPNEPSAFPANPHGCQQHDQSPTEQNQSPALQDPRARESVLAVSGEKVSKSTDLESLNLEAILRDLERSWPKPRCRDADRPQRDSAIFNVRGALPADLVELARLYVDAHEFSDDSIAGCPNLHRWISEKRWLEPLPNRRRKSVQPQVSLTADDREQAWEEVRRRNREKDAA